MRDKLFVCVGCKVQRFVSVPVRGPMPSLACDTCAQPMIATFPSQVPFLFGETSATTVTDETTPPADAPETSGVPADESSAPAVAAGA